MQNTDVRKVVDLIMKSNKTIVGFTHWKMDPDADGWRWLGSVEIDDEQRGINVVAKAFPRQGTLRFSIMLTFGRCLWRVDSTDKEHLNPLNAPIYAGQLIRGPHYHAWNDNRKLATANSLPKRLKFARPLPESIQGFKPVFRWFLDETNIYVDSCDIPDFPRRDTLL